MNKSLFILMNMLCFFSIQSSKLLHLTFHKGCENDFAQVAKELNLDVTTWFIHDDHVKFDGSKQSSAEVYNIGLSRAKRVWERHKDYFNSFDAIITSDTAPLARIFLQNGWSRPLIIWICNRFDYAHGHGIEERFPDSAYYEIMKQACNKKNVQIIAYTPFEYEYARRKGIDFGTKTIKPIGAKEKESDDFISFIPNTIKKDETLFIYPRLEDHYLSLVRNACRSQGLSVWSGKYNGPEDLKSFRGVIFVPYAFSNLCLFEDLQRGIIHFVPTKRFLREIGSVWDPILRANLDWCEWYFKEYEEVLVFFDSWADLKQKVFSIDKEVLSKKCRKFGLKHYNSMLNEWKNILIDLNLLVTEN